MGACDVIEPLIHVLSFAVTLVVYSVFVMTDRMRPEMTQPGLLTSTMTLSLILALGSNVTYLAGKFARIDLDPHRLLTAAVATTSLLFFGTLDAWNAIRYQDKIGNHNKDTKNDNKVHFYNSMLCHLLLL